MLTRFLPFLNWFKNYDREVFKADLISGITIALVMIPQSMAYAKLAGLPVYYGLYASFLPPIISALFGSSNHLATGPVAVISLMTSSALEPLATAGSAEYIAYAIILALMVGVFQLLLGVVKLGVIVNFLSHPVVQGFTFAAAIIIATSQLSKIFGVHVDKAETHYETVWLVLKSAWHYIHLPTLGMATLAFAIMIGLRKINPKIPNVLVAVAITTFLSWIVGFENLKKTSLQTIQSEQVQKEVNTYNTLSNEIDQITKMANNKKDQSNIDHQKLDVDSKAFGDDSVVMNKTKIGNQTCYYCHQQGPFNQQAPLKNYAGIRFDEIKAVFHQKEFLLDHVKGLKKEQKKYRAQLRKYLFEAATDTDNKTFYFIRGEVPDGYKKDGRVWRMIVKNGQLNLSSIVMSGGGDVVGSIPVGLPKISMPHFDWSVIISFLPVMVIISLLGFMEAISIANALAYKTGQQLDPNQELIGQGLANILGSFSQSYPVSGSFSRSAVNYKAGGITGMSNVFSGLCVAITLLLFTPMLYHLPNAVLVAIIMMAVLGLINFKAFAHVFRVQKYDGMVGLTTFILTLVFAPHLDRGIIIGVVLTLILYMLRRTDSRITYLSKMPDGSFRNAERFHLRQCKHILIIRNQGSLTFINCKNLKNSIVEKTAKMPDLRHVLIVGNAISEIDASGEEVLSSLVDYLQENGYGVSFSGLNDSVLDVLNRTSLFKRIGEENFYRSANEAVTNIYLNTHEGANFERCPLFDSRFAEVLNLKVV